MADTIDGLQRSCGTMNAVTVATTTRIHPRTQASLGGQYSSVDDSHALNSTDTLRYRPGECLTRRAASTYEDAIASAASSTSTSMLPDQHGQGWARPTSAEERRNVAGGDTPTDLAVALSGRRAW